MEAKDTVMKTIEELKPYHSIGKYTVGDVGAEILIAEDVWDIPKLLKAQAEISFKAGMREVVELVNEYALAKNYLDGRLVIGDIVIYEAFWQAKLKEWGIDD